MERQRVPNVADAAYITLIVMVSFGAMNASGVRMSRIWISLRGTSLANLGLLPLLV